MTENRAFILLRRESLFEEVQSVCFVKRKMLFKDHLFLLKKALTAKFAQFIDKKQQE
jgi:hypothetical protein